MRALVLLCICRVLALAGPNCQSEITKDCGTATGDACKKCVESHGLHKHGCTNAQIASICAGGPSPTPPSPGPAGNVLTKVLLNNSDPSAIGGRCGDGSPAGYYYAAAQPSATNKWVIHMKGGGACQTEASCKGWMAQKGSSKNWIPTIDGNPHLEPLIDGDSAQNPDFHTWNRVRVNYCTGDSHAGQRTGPSADTWNYWFDGHLNVQRVISDLKAKHGLGNATHVLVSGESAGGIGLFVNIDYIASLLPDDVIIKGAPQAGWFFPEDPVATPKGAGFPLTFEAKEITHSTALPFNVSNGDPLQHRYAPPACVAAQLNASYCFSAHNIYPHITAPMFIVENQYDTAQIYANYGRAPKHPKTGKEVAQKADYVSYYGTTMRNSIVPQIKAHGQTKAKGKDGMFLPSCLSHALSTESTLAAQVSASNSTQQVNWVEMVGDWYFERNKFASHLLIDDCKMTDGQPCNPNCPEA